MPFNLTSSLRSLPLLFILLSFFSPLCSPSPSSSFSSAAAALPPAPYIYAVTGCPYYSLTNTTAGCNAGDVITVIGSNFAHPFELRLWASARDDFYLQNTTFVSSSAIVAVLPRIVTTGRSFYIRVYLPDTQQFSNAPMYVSYANQSPVITAITGCSIPSPLPTLNGTADCLPGTRIYMKGEKFYPDPTLRGIINDQWSCDGGEYYNESMVSCVLPNLPRELWWPAVLTARMLDGGLSSNYASMLMYAKLPPSSTSTPLSAPPVSSSTGSGSSESGSSSGSSSSIDGGGEDGGSTGDGASDGSASTVSSSVAAAAGGTIGGVVGVALLVCLCL